MGCGSGGLGAGGNADSGTLCGCKDYTECPGGQSCVAGCCRNPVADGGPRDQAPGGTSDILVSPTMLDFGSALLGTETSLPLTITNLGDGALRISRLAVIEQDALDEFSSPDAGDVDWRIEVGETREVTVVVAPEDDEDDYGELRIVSDDPDTPVLVVPLISELKGEVTLLACVLTGLDPFFDCRDPEEISFDGIDWGATATQDVALHNAGEENQPAEIYDVLIPGDSGFGDLFTVDLYVLEGDPPVETPVVVSTAEPWLLNPGSETVVPNVMYVRVTFIASDDGGLVPDEVLRIVSNDPDGDYDVPIVGAEVGCPPGFEDLNGVLEDGCEATPCPSTMGNCDGDPGNGCETPLDTVSDCGGCGASCDLANASEACAAGGVCVVTACDEGYGSCDGDDATGCETPLATSTDCGSCGTPCTLDNASGSCGTGACVVDACDAGWSDCDGDPGNGCETLVTTVSNCGACGVVCDVPNASETCASGACEMTACDPGAGDCDGVATTGCETPLVTLANCGACGAPCALPNAVETCATGTCAIVSCVGGWGNCDGEATDGCETPLTSPVDCGACGAPCDFANALETCASGACTLTGCDAGFGNCNGLSADGCEASLATLANCGACAATCDLANVSESCASGACTLVACAAGWGNCDGVVGNGCETLLSSLASCGVCGSPCDLPNASETCATGACAVVTCAAGWGDCDGADANGCEANLNASASDCGACGAACTNPNGTTSCVAGGCAPVCAVGFASCDGDPDNGCEAAVCGGCGFICDYANASETCATGVCELVACDAEFGNCDGANGNGCETPLTTVVSCGVCGTACTNPNGTASCTGGACAPGCAGGFGSCDGNPNNGCETSLATLVNCGACGASCALVNASESCAGGTCALVACSAGFGDCDGVSANGCELAVTTTSNCGACGVACTNANGGTGCTGGACAPVCAGGFGDCDGDPSDGCESSLTTLVNCGACGTVCALANGSESCATGVCTLIACTAGFGDCDGLDANGCEASLATVSSCGACGASCINANGTTSCAGGACAPVCSAGFASCDSNPNNGCETSLGTSVANCGACGTACTNPNGGTSCAAGACMPTCAAGFGDCDGDPNDGCEAALNTLVNCAACGGVCALANASESCATGTCVITGCTADFGDCNGVAADGCETAATTTTNCGGCGVACTNANGSTTCAGGACVPSCSAGFGDCDGDPNNGCETSFTTLADCGACGSICDVPNATESCSGGACTVSACSAGWGNCDGAASNGCETALTTASNCGACGSTCTNANGSTTCSGGACSPTCAAGYASCDGNPNNGCETSLTTLTNCGTCGTACALASAAESCAAGICTLTSCAAGYGNCNGVTADGCEASLTTLTSCGSCDATCELANASESCSTGTCTLGSCAAGFGDCDGASGNGCETSVTTTANCGTCGNACSNPSGTTSCTGGVCAPVCSAGFASCDSNPSNGCEQSLSSLAHCGTCGVPCALANASESCATASCVLTTCDAGWGNCDGIASNGCELSLTTVTNCGACATACTNANGTTSCSGGFCTPTCSAGYASCDGNSNNGCEASTSTSVSNCGTCGTICTNPNGTTSCVSGACTPVCAAGYASCDGNANNGCETSTTTLTNCGACGTACALASATESCATGSCAITACDTGYGNCDAVTSNGCEGALNTTSNCGVCGTTCAYACSPSLTCDHPDTCTNPFMINGINYGPATFTDNMSNYTANVSGTCGSAGDDVIHAITIPESGGFTAFSTIVVDSTGSAIETASHIATTCGSSATQLQHASSVCGASTSSGTTCHNPAGTEILRACGMPTDTYYTTLDSTVSTGAFTLSLEVANVNLDTCAQSGNVSNPPVTVTNTTTGKADDYTFDLTTTDSPCAGPPSVRKECGRPNGAPGGSSLWSCYPTGGLPDAEDIVFYYRAAASGFLSVTTEGSSFDTILYIKDACIANCATPADCLRCNDDHNFGAGASWSQIYRLPVTAGTIYYIFVDGFDLADGIVVLNVSFSTT